MTIKVEFKCRYCGAVIDVWDAPENSVKPGTTEIGGCVCDRVECQGKAHRDHFNGVQALRAQYDWPDGQTPRQHAQRARRAREYAARQGRRS